MGTGGRREIHLVTWGDGMGRTKRTVMKRNCTEVQELHNMALASSVSKVTQSTSLKMSVKRFFLQEFIDLYGEN